MVLGAQKLVPDRLGVDVLKRVESGNRREAAGEHDMRHDACAYRTGNRPGQSLQSCLLLLCRPGVVDLLVFVAYIYILLSKIAIEGLAVVKQDLGRWCNTIRRQLHEQLNEFGAHAKWIVNGSWCVDNTLAKIVDGAIVIAIACEWTVLACVDVFPPELVVQHQAVAVAAGLGCVILIDQGNIGTPFTSLVQEALLHQVMRLVQHDSHGALVDDASFAIVAETLDHVRDAEP